MVRTCAAYYCNAEYVKGGQLSFHTFPSDPDRRNAWLTAMLQGRKSNFVPRKFSVLCSKHFSQDCFYSYGDVNKTLKPGAIPTIFHTSPREVIRQSSSLEEFSRSFVPFVKGIFTHQEASMDTQLQPVSADPEDEDTITTNYQNFEQIFIKGEPLEENSQNSELYENVLQNVKKKECDNQTEITRIKKYQCPVCKKSFRGNSHLKDHMKIHNGIKDYHCSSCGKSFRQRSHLKKHMNRIHEQ